MPSYGRIHRRGNGAGGECLNVPSNGKGGQTRAEQGTGISNIASILFLLATSACMAHGPWEHLGGAGPYIGPTADVDRKDLATPRAHTSASAPLRGLVRLR